MSARVLLLMNHAGAPPGTLTRIIREHGTRASVLLPLHELSFDSEVPARLPDSPDEVAERFDGLVILGGVMSVNDSGRYPFLDKTRRLIRAFGVVEAPVLGICLGAQLIASAYGSEIFASPEFEFGFRKQEFLPASEGDSLLKGFAEPLWAMHWHQDSFDIPEGAVHLMTSEKVPSQAFRMGSCAYGFQFHFEVHEPILRRWTALRAKEIGIPEEDFLAQQAESWRIHQPRQEAFAQTIMTRWLDLVAERHFSRFSP